MAVLPLFPTAYGKEVEKAAAVATTVELVRLTGHPVHDGRGGALYGGHSLRTGGAKLLASRGVNPFKIQQLGRWRSPLVVHYAGEALATGIAADLMRTPNSEHLNERPVGRREFDSLVDRVNA